MSRYIWVVFILAGSVFGMTERKNFSGQTTPSVIDTVYQWCNFSQTLPDPNVVNADVEPDRVRIFPGDDTPRTFIECNLRNCEAPPGSTLIRCATSIAVNNTRIGGLVVTVDGVSSSMDFYGTKVWRADHWYTSDSIPSIPDQTIDTTGAQYQSLLAGIQTLRTLMQPRLRLFAMASDEQRMAWWKKDELLKALLLLLRDGREYINNLEGLDDEE